MKRRTRLRGLNRGEYRLLYVAPERLMLERFLERALNWNIAQIAIDEAHCISEWGHDFRPEYRELKKLRETFARRADHGADRHRDRAGARRHRQATELARRRAVTSPASIGRISPIASFQSRRLTNNCWRSFAAGLTKAASFIARAARPPTRWRDELERGRNQGEAVSRGAEADGARETSGTVSARRRARDHGDDRVRHGDQQAERPLRHASRSAEKHRELLPGNRPRRPRRTAGRVRAALQRGRRGETDALHRREKRHENSGSRGSNCGKWCTTPRRATAAAPRCCAISAKNCQTCPATAAIIVSTPRETFDGTVRRAEISLLRLSHPRRNSGFGFGLNHIVDVLTRRGYGSDPAARPRSNFRPTASGTS